MNDDRRSYRAWLKLAKEKNTIMRHDVDFDIETAERMIELEMEAGVKSITYFDIHSPSYTRSQVYDIVRKYKRHGFMFGLHINTAYDYPADEAWEKYKEDVHTFGYSSATAHSVVGHAYDSRIVPLPEYTNRDIEVASTYDEQMPNSFKTAFFHKVKPYMMSDSGGQLFSGNAVKDGRGFFEFLQPEHTSFVLTHPVHWRIDGDDVIFAKRLGGLPNTTQNIHIMQSKFKNRLTTYCQCWIENTHLYKVYNLIEQIVREDYRKLYRVVDAGCAVGLLGMYMTGINNVKYTGYDLNKEFINVGKDMYDALGFSPDLRVKDMYKGDVVPGDIFVLAAAEDLPMNYKKIYEICKNYKYAVMTTVTKERYEESKARGKKYWYISDTDFQAMFGESFDCTYKTKINNRNLYLLKRKEQ